MTNPDQYCLQIAGYHIVIELPLHNIPIGSIYNNFLQGRCLHPDIKITLKYGIPDFNFLPDSNLKADLSTHSTEVMTQRNWVVLEKNQEYFVSVFANDGSGLTDCILHVTNNKNWLLYIKEPPVGTQTDLLAHPLGSIIIYYCTVKFNDIFLHGSGVFHDDTGRIFSGFSGAGKTTMARIWKQNGSVVIHDDRLVIRKINGRWIMHNTPVYDTDFPKSAPVNEIYFIYHDKINQVTKITGSGAVAKVISCCIQHDFDKKIIESLLNSVSDLCAGIYLYNLGFSPDEKIINFITHQK